MDAHHAERVIISVRKVEMQKNSQFFALTVLAFGGHKWLSCSKLQGEE